MDIVDEKANQEKKQSGPKAKPGAKKGTTKATGLDYAEWDSRR